MPALFQHKSIPQKRLELTYNPRAEGFWFHRLPESAFESDAQVEDPVGPDAMAKAKRGQGKNSRRDA
jgi:hypothetical protein